jgi:hypothetical protein
MESSNYNLNMHEATRPAALRGFAARNADALLRAINIIPSPAVPQQPQPMIATTVMPIMAQANTQSNGTNFRQQDHENDDSNDEDVIEEEVYDSDEEDQEQQPPQRPAQKSIPKTAQVATKRVPSPPRNTRYPKRSRNDKN